MPVAQSGDDWSNLLILGSVSLLSLHRFLDCWQTIPNLNDQRTGFRELPSWQSSLPEQPTKRLTTVVVFI